MKKFLFIYGSLKRGFSLSFLLKGAQFISEGYIQGPYKLFFHEGGYPCLISGKFQNAKIYGEIYLITSQTMIQEIDRVEGHPLEYKREGVALYSKNLSDQIALIGDAYIYQSHEDLDFNHFIPSGTFLESDIPQNLRYSKKGSAECERSQNKLLTKPDND
ncbi:MAG: gamma-glutamylcyclotransferase [Oligoflexales bacterium]|nr:gamma-glutamylcyclotransferase [Oligoflexales bacterium]